MDEVQSAAPKSKVLNRKRVRFEVAGGNHRLVVAFDFRRQVAFVKALMTEYDHIDALTVSPYSRANDAWKSGRSTPIKITKPCSQRSMPTGVHLSVPNKVIGLMCFSHLSRSRQRSDGVPISANALIRSTSSTMSSTSSGARRRNWPSS
jgi:hypothetical protein